LATAGWATARTYPVKRYNYNKDYNYPKGSILGDAAPSAATPEA